MYLKLKYIISKVLKKLLNIPAIKNSWIDKSSKVCSGSHLVDSTVSRFSYVGNYCTVVNTSIGSFCSIADNCIIGGESHPIGWVSTSPVFHHGKNVLSKNFSTHLYKTSKKTTLGNDVWIGSSCHLKSGISVGNGAIIGMGSVVTKDVEPYTIVAGNPARLIRKRFDDEIVVELQTLKWWEYDDSKLNLLSQYITKPNDFIMQCSILENRDQEC